MLRALTRPRFRETGAPSLALLIAVTMTGTMAMHIVVPAMPAAARSLAVSPALMVLYSVGVGLTSPNAVGGLMNAAPGAVGTASSLYGFCQMLFGALVTVAVAGWHSPSALPVAVILLIASLVARLAVRRSE